MDEVLDIVARYIFMISKRKLCSLAFNPSFTFPQDKKRNLKMGWCKTN